MRTITLTLSLIAAGILATACGKPGSKNVSPEEQIISYRTRASDGSCELAKKHFKGLKAFCSFLINEELNENCAREKRHNQFRAKCVVDGKPVIDDVPESILNSESDLETDRTTPADTTPGGEEDDPQVTGDPTQTDLNRQDPPSAAPAVVDQTPDTRQVETVNLVLLGQFKATEDFLTIDSNRIEANAGGGENKIISINIDFELIPPRQRLDDDIIKIAMGDQDLLDIESGQGVRPVDCDLTLSGDLRVKSSSGSVSKVMLRGLDPINPNQKDVKGPCETFAQTLKASMTSGDLIQIAIRNMPHDSKDNVVFGEIELSIEPTPEVGAERDASETGAAPDVGMVEVDGSATRTAPETDDQLPEE